MEGTRYSSHVLIKFEFFSTDFRKNTQIRNLTKIRPVEAQLFHADKWTAGRTDRQDKANSRFSQFCERA